MQPLLNSLCKERRATCIAARGWRYLLLLIGMGCVLFFGLDGAAQAAGFNPVGSMGSARQLHTAALLANGDVLIAGGYTNTSLAGAERYNAVTGTFSSTGSMVIARRSHTATRLSNGKVLIAGGNNSGSSPLASAEIYDPATGLFTLTGNMIASGRQLHTATLLVDGTVLITGGRSSYGSSSTAFNTAEIYDPTTGLFTATTGAMNQSRAYHAANLLADGKVLITGGVTPSGATATAEIYDPVTGLFTATANMTSARNYHAAVLLNDNTVLISGGATGSTGTSLNSAEIFNPAGSGSFSAAGTMSAAHSKHTATLLANGSVLIAGSQDYNGAYTYSGVAEIYVPGSGFEGPWDMITARASHTATLLANGMVLLAGGQTDASNAIVTTELFNNSSMTVVPDIYPFPATIINQTSLAVFTMGNDSEVDLIVSTISISGQDSAMFAKTGTCTGLPSQGGRCTITVTFTPATAGLKSAWLDIDSNDPVLPHLSIYLSGTGSKISQTITVTTPAPAEAAFNSSFTVAATASSGLPVSYSSATPDICTNVGPQFTMASSSGDDTCTVQYSQAGNATYSAAPQVSSSTTASPASQTIGAISFSPATLQVGGTTTASASGGASGNPVIFTSLTTSVCTVSGDNGSTITSVSLGTCTIAANQAGDSDYSAASQAANSLYLLTVTPEGTGSGSVNSTPAGIACITGNSSGCSLHFAGGSIVTLIPLGSNSSFSGWSGACSNPSGDCLLTMASEKSVVATFTADPAKVSIVGDATPYYLINTALDAILAEGKTVKVLDQIFAEDVTMTSPVMIILKGGYSDSGFTTQSPAGYSVIDGSMFIRSGTLKVSRVKIR